MLLLTLLSFLGYVWHSHDSVIPSDQKIETATIVGRRAKRATEEVHSCSSMVYCQGDLLDTVQKQKLYADSKTFVDMSQINEENVTLANFQAMMASTNNNPAKEDVQKFVHDNFVFENETVSE